MFGFLKPEKRAYRKLRPVLIYIGLIAIGFILWKTVASVLIGVGLFGLIWYLYRRG